MTIKIGANAIIAEVFYNPLYRKCANGGISERAETVLIYWGDPKELTPDDLEIKNLVLLRFRGGYKSLVPADQHFAGRWSMMGGSFAYSCDSRFRENVNDYPVPIHDRLEN